MDSFDLTEGKMLYLFCFIGILGFAVFMWIKSRLKKRRLQKAEAFIITKLSFRWIRRHQLMNMLKAESIRLEKSEFDRLVKEMKDKRRLTDRWVDDKKTQRSAHEFRVPFSNEEEKIRDRFEEETKATITQNSVDFLAELPELQKSYPDEYVAFSGKKVMMHSPDSEVLRLELEDKYPKIFPSFYIGFVSKEEVDEMVDEQEVVGNAS